MNHSYVFAIHRIVKGYLSKNKGYALILARQEKYDYFGQPKVRFKEGEGLLFKIWYTHGCLGTRHWTSRVGGTSTYWEITTEVLKRDHSIYLAFWDSLVVGCQKDLDESRVRACLSLSGFKEVKFPVSRYTKDYCDSGDFHDIVVCG